MSMNATCEDISTLLNANALGVEGTDLFCFQWGSGDNGKEIDKQIVVMDTADLDAMIKDEYENPTFVIMVRGDTTEGVKSVHDRARNIYEFMLQRPREVLNGNTYVQYAPLGGLLPMGKDDNNRFVFSMNFFTYREAIGA